MREVAAREGVEIRAFDRDGCQKAVAAGDHTAWSPNEANRERPRGDVLH